MGTAIDGQKGKPGALRRGLMLYGSTAAMAAALMLCEGGVGPALAQEIGPRITPTYAAQGDFSVPAPAPSGSGTPPPGSGTGFSYRSNTLDIVSMDGSTVLNWQTYDTAPPGGAQGNSYVNFLPAGTELRFVGNGESFTAVNRVFTTPDQAGAYRGIAIQGQVTSYLSGDGPSSVGPVGGNIWFYSPGGILATGSASFNVGSLVLSASNFDSVVEGSGYRYANLTGVADPFASVIIQPGAQITLAQPGSTFAVIAPTIEQGGQVSVNGSTLYMSAEQGYLSVYDSGSVYGYVYVDAQAGNRIHHTGTTTGPASLGRDDGSIYDYQTIEFRTGADVDALLSGSIGYAGATDAALSDNGSIVLSIGGRVASEGNLTLNSTTYGDADSVDLHARAGEVISAGSDANGGYDFSVRTAADGSVTASAGGRIDIGGSLSIARQNYSSPNLTLTLEAASGNLAGGRINVGGDLVFDASANGFYFNGGQQGGSAAVTIANGGHLSVAGDMKLLANGMVTEDDGGIVSSVGGTASVTMTGANASLSVGDLLVISAEATPFSNCECSPSGGFAQGGSATLSATSGTISAGSLSVIADARGNQSDYVNSDAATDATGGTALVDLGGSTASFGTVLVSARGYGAAGVRGGDGRDGFGGTASFAKGGGGSLTATGLTVTAAAFGGLGGDPYEGTAPGSGGNAQGGTASLMLGQTVQNLSYLDLSAQANGLDDGEQANGGSAEAYYDLDGGRGGDATGGTVSLALTGADTVLSGLTESTISIAAYGGDGGNGAEDYYNAVQSGNGGRGGSATAGTLTITAADGATYQSEAYLSVSALGGKGGRGGNAVYGEGETGAFGFGGDGGDATGGVVSLIADGGTIAGDLAIDVRGEGGEGGLHGYDEFENIPGGGAYGAFTGGSIALTTTDNGPSRFDLGYVTLSASGDRSGPITITHAATAPDAQMHFGQLYASATGEPGGETPAFLLSAVNTVTMGSAFQVGAGSIALEFSGIGAVSNGGSTSLSSFDGPITITHANNPGVISLDSAGFFSAGSDSDYFAGPGTIVRSGNDEFTIYARGSITAADSRANGSMLMSAEGNVAVGDVTVGSGYYSNGDFRLYAGRIEYDGPHGYVPTGNARVTGTVEVSGSVFVEAGGVAEFATGSEVLADNDIWVRTGDDIVVASGASLVSDIAPNQDLSIHLLAGDINLGGRSGDLIDPIGTPIASLVIAGSLDTNGASLYLSGDAIDGTGGTVRTRNLYVDVTDAPPFGPYSNDGGLLNVDCRQGSACLGSLNASGDVEIGLDSNNGLVMFTAGAVNFDGDNFLALTSERLDLNTLGVAGEIYASGTVSLVSINDAVLVNNAVVEANALDINAGTSLVAGNSTFRSANSIAITVGDDLLAGTIATGGSLDDGSDSAFFTTPGDFLVGSLTYGGGQDMVIRAGGDLSLGFADPTGRDIDLRAERSLFLGSTAANTGAIELDGSSVSFDNLTASGLVHIVGGAGGVTGVSEGVSAIDTDGAIAIETMGDVTVGELVAGTDIAISGNAISALSLSATDDLAVDAGGAVAIGSFGAGGNANFTGTSLDLGSGGAGGEIAAEASGGNLAFAALDAGGNVNLVASGAIAGGDVDAGGKLTLAGSSLSLGAARSAGALSARTPGAASFTSLTSRNGAVSLDAGGAVTGGSANAAGAITLAGSSISLNNANFGGGLTLTARTGGISGTGLYQGTGDASLTSPRGIAIGSIDTLGAIAIDAGMEARFAELRSRDGSVGVTSGLGGITGGSVAATGSVADGDDSVRLTSSGAITIDGATSALNPVSRAQDDFLVTAGGPVALVRAEAGRDLTLGAGSGSASGANLVAGRDLSLTGQSVDLAAGAVGRNLVARATAGNIAGSGLTTAGGAIDLGASGNIAVGSLRANGGGLISNAGGTIGYSDLSASGALALTAGGAISGSGLAGGTGVTVRGTSLTLGSVSGGTGEARLDATAGALSAGAVSAANVHALATGAVQLGALAAGQAADIRGASLTLASASAGSNLIIESGSAGGITTGALSAGGNLSVDAGSQGFTGSGVTAGGELELASGGGVTFISASAGGSADIDAAGAIAGGTVTAANRATLDAGGTIGLTGLTAGSATLRSTGGAISASGIQVSGLLQASGTALTLAAPGALIVDARATAGAVGITSGGDLRVSANATGAITLASTGGSVFIGSVNQSDSVPGGIGAEAVSGSGAVAVSALNGISVADSLSAGGALSLTAGGLVSLDGATSGQTITLRSGDLAIGTGGSLGSAGTQRISLASSNAVNIGTGASGGFAIDAVEFGRIQSGGDLLIAALAGTGTGAGTLAVGSLTVNAGSGGQIGSTGTFGLTANGVLDINNTLAIARGGAGNTLTLTGDSVDLDYGDAALAVLDSASAPTGRIVVNGRLITSMSASAAADIVGKTPGEINVRLGTADLMREIGLFRTANLTLEGRDAILIQNSGGAAVDARRGLTVGALTVTGAADGHTLVVINGIVNSATGVGAAQNVTLTTPIAAGSTVNGCSLANIAGCLVVPEPPAPLIVAPESILFGTGDLIESEDEDDEVEDGVADGKPEAPPIDTTRIDDPAGLPMIDDPVTGAGNEDLWQSPGPQGS